jgi:hypothetical protein
MWIGDSAVVFAPPKAERSCPLGLRKERCLNQPRGQWVLRLMAA